MRISDWSSDVCSSDLAGRFRGALHGFPHAVKDTAAAKGIRLTQGSPILKDNIPSADSLVVGRMRDAGAIFIGKSNVPEFALARTRPIRSSERQGTPSTPARRPRAARAPGP